MLEYRGIAVCPLFFMPFVIFVTEIMDRVPYNNKRIEYSKQYAI